MTDLSLLEARQIALAAHGFGGIAGGRGAGAGARSQVIACVRRLGVLQLDSVSVVCRAHYLPLFARLGAYDREVLDRAAWAGPRTLFEYWGHEASLLPIERQPLFRWRMARAARGEGMWKFVARFAEERRPFVDEVLARIAREGPLRAKDFEEPTRAPRGGWWNRSDAKRALEWLFWAGLVTTSTRVHFARVYDLPERVLPRKVLDQPTPSEDDAKRELLRIAATALGVATEDDLADYFRIGRLAARPLLEELVEEGALRRVRVEGWSPGAFLARGAARAKVPGESREPRESRVALLAPFDPVVWHRPRALRLFDFHYRIGIYTPAHARTHGYYVLPVLVGDRLAGRVDLKADRTTGDLVVQSSHVEPGVDPARIAPGVARELAEMASWLGLARVAVVRKGKLAVKLQTAVRSAAAR